MTLILTEKHLYDYDEMGRMKLQKEAKAQVKTETAESCARDCTYKTDFECRSFDFCVDTKDSNLKTCLQHESHLFRTNEGQQKIELDLNATSCTHYSSKNSYLN